MTGVVITVGVVVTIGVVVTAAGVVVIIGVVVTAAGIVVTIGVVVTAAGVVVVIGVMVAATGVVTAGVVGSATGNGLISFGTACGVVTVVDVDADDKAGDSEAASACTSTVPAVDDVTCAASASLCCWPTNWLGKLAAEVASSPPPPQATSMSELDKMKG